MDLTNSDISAVFLVRDVLTLIFGHDEHDPSFLHSETEVISGGWRCYQVFTAMPVLKLEFTLNFTLIRYGVRGSSTHRYWALATDGLIVKMELDEKAYELQFFNQKEGTLYPAIGSEEPLKEVQAALAEKNRGA